MLPIQHELGSIDRKGVFLGIIAVEVVAGAALVDLDLGHIARLNCQCRTNKYY